MGAQPVDKSPPHAKAVRPDQPASATTRNVVRFLAAYRGRNADEIAAAAGIATSTYYGRMNGGTTFDVDEIDRLARYFNVPTIWFLEGIPGFDVNSSASSHDPFPGATPRPFGRPAPAVPGQTPMFPHLLPAPLAV